MYTRFLTETSMLYSSSFKPTTFFAKSAVYEAEINTEKSCTTTVAASNMKLLDESSVLANFMKLKGLSTLCVSGNFLYDRSASPKAHVLAVK